MRFSSFGHADKAGPRAVPQNLPAIRELSPPEMATCSRMSVKFNLQVPLIPQLPGSDSAARFWNPLGPAGMLVCRRMRFARPGMAVGLGVAGIDALMQVLHHDLDCVEKRANVGP